MALIYRAYYAMVKSPRITSKGVNTSATLGFTNTLYEVLRQEQPTHIAVAFDKDNVYTYPGEMKQSGDEDATIVATHMILAATDEGLGTCWLNRFDPMETAKVLGLPENEELVMLMDVGYAAEDAAPSPMHGNRKDLSETVKYL